MPEHIDYAVFVYWALIIAGSALLAWVAIRNEPPSAA